MPPAFAEILLVFKDTCCGKLPLRVRNDKIGRPVFAVAGGFKGLKGKR